MMNRRNFLTALGVMGVGTVASKFLANEPPIVPTKRRTLRDEYAYDLDAESSSAEKELAKLLREEIDREVLRAFRWATRSG